MSAKDLQDFYSILGVSPTATAAEIKVAYRSKAMDLHPDRNPSRDTTAEFQALQAAYGVLSDESLRQQYDANSAIPLSAMNNFEDSHEPLAPIFCSKCSAVSAQPRYKVFYSVYGYIFGAHKKPHQGIFCSKCEVKEGLKASAVTIVAGWWSVAGFFWTAQVLIQNLVGGRFYEQNARLQGYQAMYFAQQGALELAKAVAIEAIKLAKKASAGNASRSSFKRKLGHATSDPLQPLRESLTSLINAMPADVKIGELKNTRVVFNKRFAYQSLLLLTVGSLFSSALYLQNEQVRGTEKIRLQQQGIDSARAAAIVAQEKEELKRSELPLPVNGIFSMTGRRGPQQTHAAPFKVTNSPDANTLLKLIRLSDGVEVMSIFIRAGQTVEVEVPIGSYKAKIASGQTWYGESIRFGPDTGYATLDTVLDFYIEGAQVLGNELRLTQVEGGNLRKVSLSASDF